MPTISVFYGIVIQMFWRDHNPPHFHALYGEREAVLDLRDLRVLRGRLPRRAMVLVLARIIHEGFYCNRRYAAATSLTAGGLAARSVNILFQVCLPPSRLCAPGSPAVSTVSSRTFVNNAG